MLEATSEVVEQLVYREVSCMRGIGYTSTRHLEYIEEERSKVPMLDELLTMGLLHVKQYREGNYPEYRIELSNEGYAYYRSIPVVQKLRALVRYMKYSNGRDNLFYTCMDYVGLLSLGELPIFLVYNNGYIVELAKKRFDELLKKRTMKKSILGALVTRFL